MVTTTVPLSRDDAVALDQQSPLRDRRELFVLPDGLVYLDGNSLGALPRTVPARMQQVVSEEWGTGLISSWITADWVSLGRRVGARIAPLVGVDPADVHVGDSTSVTLFKTFVACARLRPDRRVVVVEPSTFPTDGYVAAGVARALDLELRWCDPADPAASLGEDVALLALTHVDFRTGAMFDMAGLTRAAHDVGALAHWDLCHSAGAVPVSLVDAEADVAVGCTYKYLNGGPGAPAFAYVASRHLAELAQPIQGWMGVRDVFLRGPEYQPAEGLRRFLSGTPPIVGMLAMRDTIAMIEEAGIEAVRAKSVALTEFAIALADEWLTPLGVALASPRDAEHRGGHITLSHPAMRDVTALLWQRDVIPDYRDPDGLRVGLSPLSTSFEEVCAGMAAVRDALGELTHD